MLRFSRALTIPPLHTIASRYAFPDATASVKTLSEGTSVVLHGHIHRKPKILSQMAFAELRDTNGDTVQLMGNDESAIQALSAAQTECSVCVEGRVQAKRAAPGQKSALEVHISRLSILNTSNLDAARLDKLKHSSPGDIPPQFRYLQLRTRQYQHNLRVRSRVASAMRQVFEQHGFTELETPLLFKSTPEGAREFLVPTRTRNRFYALPQSPQQYKQILMASGFDKYFQFARCFRDEDLRSDRQPEFTQVDLEMAFVNDSAVVKRIVEDLVKGAWKSADKTLTTLEKEKNEKGENKDISFFHLSYKNALSLYGIDKPDLRSTLRFIDLSSYFEPLHSGFPVVEACVLRGAFDPSKPKIPKALTDPANYSRRRPYVFPIRTGNEPWHSRFLKPRPGFDEASLAKCLDLKPGDILAVSDRASLSYENPTPLGKFRQLAIAEFPDKWRLSQDPDLFVASWVVDFPLFNPVETGGTDYPEYDFSRFESTHHPFTMPDLRDYERLADDPLSVRGQHYDLVIDGNEVGGGSRRIHDPDLQEYVFRHILRIDNYKDLFGHLLAVLAMGCPPHAGLALGFDRMCALLVGSQSIRDVIAFPKNQSGCDPVVDSPSEASSLGDYHIRVSEARGEARERSERASIKASINSERSESCIERAE